MYSFDSRIRYSEVDSKGTLNWLALMDYFSGLQCVSFGKSAHWSRLSGGSSSGVGTFILADLSEPHAEACRYGNDTDLGIWNEELLWNA